MDYEYTYPMICGIGYIDPITGERVIVTEGKCIGAYEMGVFSYPKGYDIKVLIQVYMPNPHGYTPEWFVDINLYDAHTFELLGDFEGYVKEGYGWYPVTIPKALLDQSRDRYDIYVEMKGTGGVVYNNAIFTVVFSELPSFRIKEISAVDRELEVGESTYVHVVVENTGIGGGTAVVTLTDNGVVCGTKEVYIDPGSIRVVSFEYVAREAGEHNVCAEVSKKEV